MYETRLIGFACPEQYSVFLDGEEVGYLRLRHGEFRAECYKKIVYTASPEGDGIFTLEERDYYLCKALEAIDNELKKIKEQI